MTSPTPEIGDLLQGLADAAKAAGDSPTPLAAGTFAMYPTEDGGVIFAASVADGPMAGTHHHRIPPALIRAITTLAGGGGKLGAIKGMLGIGTRKAIDGR